jgi:Flp pilus assembly protein TadB
MTLLILIAFAGLIAGFFLILDLSPFEFAESVVRPFQNRKTPIGKRIEAIKNPKPVKGIRKTVRDAKEVLSLMGKEGKFGAICALSFFLMVIGLFASVLMYNFLMIPVASIGLALVPFWYLIFTSHSYKKQMNAEMETALSIITTSYLRNESIITAVQENISYLNPPISNVFQSFLTQAKMINVNVKQALTDMKPKLNHYVSSEWVDAMIACQEDKTLKTTLSPIISKLSDMRIVSAELDYLMYEPLKEFITMALLLVANIPLIYFLNRDWYSVLVNTAFGKGILAISAFAILVSFAAVIRLTKPIEYKR